MTTTAFDNSKHFHHPASVANESYLVQWITDHAINRISRFVLQEILYWETIITLSGLRALTSDSEQVRGHFSDCQL